MSMKKMLGWLLIAVIIFASMSLHDNAFTVLGSVKGKVIQKVGPFKNNTGLEADDFHIKFDTSIESLTSDKFKECKTDSLRKTWDCKDGQVPNEGEMNLIIKTKDGIETKNIEEWWYTQGGTHLRPPVKPPAPTAIVCSPTIVACDPPIHKNIIAFPTPERFSGQDLNGDGDSDDTVLRYLNLTTGQVVNTGLIASGAYRSMDIYEHIIAFVGDGGRIRYYDINSGAAGETGAVGLRPAIYGPVIAFAGQDTIQYFDLRTQTLVDTGIPGYSPAIYGDTIAFHVFSSKPTIWTYDLRSGAAVDTGIVGRDATLYQDKVAFATPESYAGQDLNGDGDREDWVIRYYDLATQTLVNTGAVGHYPALHSGRIAFATPEKNVNQDLDKNGQVEGSVICYYDLESGQVVNTGQPGTEPDIYEDTITFYLWERWVAQDLSGDGDRSDPVVGALQVRQ